MKNKLYWGGALLIVLLIAGMCYMLAGQYADLREYEKAAAKAEKLLAERNKQQPSKTDDTYQPPPPGETDDTGHWHGNTWHKTGPSESDHERDTDAEYISPFGGAVDQLELAERIIQERPYSEAAAEARTILLYTYRENYDKAGAIAYLKKALEYTPESSLILKDLGKELWDESPEEAMSYLQKAVSVSNPHSRAYLYLGHVYQRLGDYKTAWVHYNTGEQLNKSHSGVFIEQIWAIEAGSPLITPLPIEAPVESLDNAVKPVSPVDKADFVSVEPSQSDDFFLPQKTFDDQAPKMFVSPSGLDDRNARKRAFSEREERLEMLHPEDAYAQQELEVFIEWAETLMTDPPMDTKNFLAKELAAQLRGHKPTFAAQRITRAFETLQRHGERQGRIELEKRDAELAREMARHPRSQPNKSPHLR